MASKRKPDPAEKSSGIAEIIERFKAHPFLFGGTVVILVIVIIAFVLVPPMANVNRGERGQEMVFGYYDGKPLVLMRGNYFEQALRETAYMAGFDIQDTYGGTNYSMAYQVWYQAFIQTLVRMGILDEMKKAGYTAPSKEIDKQVAEHPEFQEEGRFSIVKYKNYDKNRLLALWRSVEDNYIAAKYMEAVTNLKISSAEKAFISAMAFPERTFELVSLPRKAYPDSELLSFAAANPNLFKTVHFSRITVNSEKEGQQVLETIRDGRSTFEDAARNHSTDSDKDRGGDMGPKMAHEVFSELAEEKDREAVLSLRQGDMSPLLKAPHSGTEQTDRWVFFRAEENSRAADLSQEENLAKVRTYMDRFEGGRIENWLVARVEELLAGAKERSMGLAAYVRSLETADIPYVASVEASTFGPVNLNYGNMGGGENEWGSRLFPRTINTGSSQELAAAVSNEHFWRTAFSTPLNTPSAPFTLGNSIVVLTPTEESDMDKTSADNIAGFYAMGWMYNTVSADIRGIFFHSDKFENDFFNRFLSMLQGVTSSRSSAPPVDEQ